MIKNFQRRERMVKGGGGEDDGEDGRYLNRLGNTAERGNGESEEKKIEDEKER